jgi:hypothetical protein
MSGETSEKVDVFRALLSEVALKSGELRALILAAGSTFLSASVAERAQMSKDAETRKLIGAAHAFISMFTSQHFTAHVLHPFVSTAVGESPLRGPEELADAMSEGMTHAAMTCTCGGCIACKLKKDRGYEVAEYEMRTRLRAQVGPSQMAMRSMGKA